MAELFLPERRAGRQHGDQAVLSKERRGLQRGLHADHRNGQLPAQRRSGGRGGGVTGNHNRLHVLFQKKIRVRLRKAQDFRLRARAVRRVFIVAKINEILARQVGAHVSEHADSADSGIEHTDRTILHRFTRFLLACSIRFMKSRPAAIREAAMGCGGFIPLPRSRAGRRRDTRSAYRRSRPASRSGG